MHAPAGILGSSKIRRRQGGGHLHGTRRRRPRPASDAAWHGRDRRGVVASVRGHAHRRKRRLARPLAGAGPARPRPLRRPGFLCHRPARRERGARGVAAHPARRTPRGARAFAGRRGRACARHRLVRPDAATRVRGRHQDRVERRGASSHGGAGAAAREAVRDASGGAGALPEGVRPRGGGRCGITGGCARCRPRGREVSPERARAGAWRWIRAPMRSASRRCPN